MKTPQSLDMDYYEPLFKPVMALNDDEHWAVYLSLIRGEPQSLTDIREHFDTTYHEVKPILDDLIESGLIEQFIIRPKDYGNLDKRFYRASILGI